MNTGNVNKHIKRTQKDYSLSFKLGVVQEVERCELSINAALRKYGIQSHGTVLNWLKKYGYFDWENQKAFLEKQVETADKKTIIFDMMIDLAEKEFNISIRKKCSPEQSIITVKSKKKQ